MPPPSSEEPIRAFIAVSIPDDVRDRITAVTGRLRGAGDVRWTPPENFHLTLKFLGNVAPERLEKLSAELHEKAKICSSFLVECRGLGAFPRLERPQVIWLGIGEGAPELCALATAVEEAGAAVGFQREQRRFHPHLTLGRVRSPKGLADLAKQLQAGASTIETLGRWEVREIQLVRSRLTPQGSIYSVLQHIALAET